MKLEKLNKNNKELWRMYVYDNKDTKIQHSLEFKELVERTYKNCESFYFFLQSNNKIRAIFPFFLVKSKRFGNRFISLPFLDVGGFFGTYDYNVLKDVFKNLKKEEFKHVEIRLNNFLKNFGRDKKLLLKSEFKEDKSRHQFIIKLKSEEEMWKNFHKHTRNDIRKAQKSGLEIKEIKDETKLKKFYDLYSREMKNFGSPQHSYKFFKNIFEITKDKVIGFNCYYKKSLLGSLLMFHHHKSAYILFNVSDIKYRQYRPNDLLYWTAIKWCFDKGIKNIDLGQVEKDAPEGSHALGLYKFKRKWLGDLYERSYFYYSKEKKKDGVEEEEKYKKFRNIWKKLPLSVTKKIGPKICAELGI